MVLHPTPEIPPVPARVLGESGSNWRLQEDESGWAFEVFHPVTGKIHCRARATRDFRRWDVLLRHESPRVSIPHPIDQLLWILPLSQVGGVFLHACGAVLEGRALVFAGHSGDGKTTLSALLADEGLSILSDERVAIRREEGGYRAYGTPWPGEGNRISSASRPLGALFLLRKAEEHRIVRAPRHALAGELIARSIVPYYVPEAAEAVLTTLAGVLSEVPIYELDFALAPGIRSVLADGLGPSRSASTSRSCSSEEAKRSAG